MSEIKGTLLAIILVIGVFTLVFPLIMSAIESNTNTVTTRMKETVEREPDVALVQPVGYTLHY